MENWFVPLDEKLFVCFEWGLPVTGVVPVYPSQAAFQAAGGTYHHVSFGMSRAEMLTKHAGIDVLDAKPERNQERSGQNRRLFCLKKSPGILFGPANPVDGRANTAGRKAGLDRSATE